jgi:carboxyl-terminal processing protease
VRINRAQITLRSVRGWARNGSREREWEYLIDPEHRIGYIRIFSFERHTTEQLDAAVRELLARHRMRALILDIRDNPGGLLPIVAEMANCFLSSGLIVSIKGRNKRETPYMADDKWTYPNFPLAILVNGGSASASEILAGALQDHRRAVLIGERTFGKGSVQEMFAVQTKGGTRGQLKLTTSYYYLPQGERIHEIGVEPDIRVELTPAERDARIEATRAVYWPRGSTAPANTPTETGPATEPSADRAEIPIDRQLEAALEVLRGSLATQPGAD